jgi:dihydropteroate synthase
VHAPRKQHRLKMRGCECVLGQRTWLMGVLNVTPDSFSDGGRFVDTHAAVEWGLAMFAAGADVVDVGGESTRPGGAARVNVATEIARVVPVVRALREKSAGWISVDTTKAAVAEEALAAGADMVNDVSALRFDPDLGRVVARAGVPLVLMHSRGAFGELHHQPRYADVSREIAAELGDALARAEAAGISRNQTVLDPGLGFAKDAGHSLEALRRLDELAVLDRPLLVGPSRKSFIGQTLDRPVGERQMGTAAAVAGAVLGGAHMVRVHDVAPMRDVVRLCDALRGEA